MELRLSVPDMRFFPSYLAALEEGFAYGSGDPFTAEEIAEIKADPEKHVAERNPPFKAGSVFTAQDGSTWPRVPQEVIWITREDEFIGAINFRPTLNDMLVNYGGHVGYSIKPSARGKGYMVEALGLLLADKDRMTKVDRDHLVITTDIDGVASSFASQKVVTKNGGHYVGEHYCVPMDDTVKIFHVPVVRS